MASILICEDEYCISNLLTAILETAHTITVAGDGNEGLKLYFNKQYDLVITDLTMPKVSGLELIHKIKSVNPDSKIIALSALLDCKDVRDTVFNAGADICLTKPIDLLNLESVIEQLLESQVF